jgi:hypothetical protein
VKSFLGGYVDGNGQVTIGPNEILVFFELSNDTDYRHSPSADFQDLVVLITLTKKTHTMGGRININPNNSSDNEFLMILPDGFSVTRDDLKSNSPKTHAGFASSGLEYTGPVSSVMVKPKGNGNQNGLIVDGAPYSLLNKNRYTITSSSMTAHLYNDNQKNGKAMGKWYVEITASNVTITTDSSQ